MMMRKLAAVGVALLTMCGLIALAPPAWADTTTYTVSSVTVGGLPGPIAVDPASHTVYVGDVGDSKFGGGTLVHVIKNGAVTATLTVGTDPDGIAVDPKTGTAYVASGNGSVSVIKNDAVVDTIKVGGTLGGIAVDPNTDTVFVVNEDANSVVTIKNDAVIGNPIGVGNDPTSIAVDPKTGTAYVVNFNAAGIGADNTVSVINNGVVTGTITVGHHPDDVAVDPNTGTVYVTNFGYFPNIGAPGNTVSVINNGAVTKTITVGTSPEGVAVDPASGNVFVASDDGTLSIINMGVVTATLTIGGRSIAVDTSTGVAYVSGYYSGSVFVLTPPDTTPPTSNLSAAPGPIRPHVPTITVTADATFSNQGSTVGTVEGVECWNSTGVDLTLTATDTGSGVAGLTYSAAGAGALPSTTSTSLPITVTVSATGLTTLSYAATDQAGNTEATQEQDVLVLRGLSCTVPAPTQWAIPDHGRVRVSGTMTLYGRTLPYSATANY